VVHRLGDLQPKAKGGAQGTAYPSQTRQNGIFVSPQQTRVATDGARVRRERYSPKPAPQAVQLGTFILRAWNASALLSNQFGAAVLLDPLWLPTGQYGSKRSRSFPPLLDLLFTSYEEMVQESVNLDGDPLDAEQYDVFLNRSHRFAVDALLSVLYIIAPRRVVKWVKSYIYIRDRLLELVKV
jgi:hypothetical protein